MADSQDNVKIEFPYPMIAKTAYLATWPLRYFFSIGGAISIFLLINITYFGLKIWEMRTDAFQIRQVEDQRITQTSNSVRSIDLKMTELVNLIGSPSVSTHTFQHPLDDIQCLKSAGTALQQLGYSNSDLKDNYRFGSITNSRGLVHLAVVHCQNGFGIITTTGGDHNFINQIKSDLSQSLEQELLGSKPVPSGPPLMVEEIK